jgi:thioredoxin reductase (NADPH)
MIAHAVARLHCDRRPYQIELNTGQKLTTRAIVIATGAQYNKPSITNSARFENVGVYFGATNLEAQLSESEEVIVVGVANSVGQTAMYLTQFATHITWRSGPTN